MTTKEATAVATATATATATRTTNGYGNGHATSNGNMNGTTTTTSTNGNTKPTTASTSKDNTTTNTSNDWSVGIGILPGRETIGPILLMMITPIFSILYYHICSSYRGNFYDFVQSQIVLNASNDITTNVVPFYAYIYTIWPSPFDTTTWYMISTFIIYQCILIKVIPGKPFIATSTPNGYRPTYKANGLSCYLITLVSLILVDYLAPYNFKAYMIYDKFGNILSTMNVLAFTLCIGLVFKGYYAPSSQYDSGTTGSIIQDFYWGTELYPIVFGYNIKQITNCRCGMMFWAVAIISFGYKNLQLNHGTIQYGIAVSILLQLIYITKFFHWEMGYMCSMDIQHDRAGYYICWGCLVWVPAVYTSASFYLTTNCPNDISLTTATIITVCGTICIWMNYDSDRQRYIFRQTNGNCIIWSSSKNKKPHHIVAKYSTADGTTKTSLLLVDGYWAYSRHFHYVPEIMASFFWSCSALDTGFIGPYFYVIYLTILLTDRAYRDDHRCRAKYGSYWEEYCQEVPYKIIPGIL